MGVIGEATVLSGLTDVMSAVGTVLTTITGNAVLSFFLACGIAGAVVGVVKKLKRAVK